MAHLLPLLVPLCFFSAALLAASAPSFRPRRMLGFVERLALLAVLAALAAAFLLVLSPPGTSPAVGFGLLAVSLRHDLVSTTMLVLVSFLGWIIIRFSSTYLDGEARQGAFAAWLAATLASVSLFAVAGTLLLLVASFVATSLCLHQLLLFYGQRPGARRAARKKFILSRLADLSLAGAALLLALGYGTGDIATILESARAGNAPVGAGAAATLIAIAALLKSAQFPTHGWLTEVMECPTPVSALLHAGIVNAGGFLLIRFADILLLSPATLGALVVTGGFTALFGGLVMLTQSAVKTSLAWSTVSQMGFMIFQCGLGLFPVALLHIVAHSLYKAHAFLSSGRAVEQVVALRRPGPVAIPDIQAVARAFLLAILIYGIAGLAFGFWHKPPQAIALGAILIFGVAYLIAQGLADAAPRELTWRICLQASVAATGYFALQAAAYALLAKTLPAPPPPGPLEWALIVLAVGTFGIVAIAQSLFPLWASHPATAGLRVHLQNGLYVNALFDRLLNHTAALSPVSGKD
nr:proton-conducting transporter membrane subunit [uncultured Gellertiella sp.]